MAAYLVFIRFVRFDPVSGAIFALSGLLGVRIKKRRPGEISFDERDKEIERRALLTTLFVAYAAVLLLTVLSIAKSDGFKAPMWIVMQCFWGGSIAMWGLKAALVIAAYRRGRDA